MSTPTTDQPPPPPGLSAPAETLWRKAVEDALDTAPAGSELTGSEEALLTQACRQLTLINRLEDALADADVIVSGSRGQDRTHSLIAEIGKARTVLAALLRAAFPPDRSAIGKANVSQRWRR